MPSTGLCNTNRDSFCGSIGNLAHAIFTARFLALPLKEDPSSHGPGLTAQEIYEAQASIFQYVFLDLDTAKSYKDRVEASKDAKMLGGVMRKVVESAKHHPGLITMLMGLLGHGYGTQAFGRRKVCRRCGLGACAYPVGCGCYAGCCGKL